MTMDMIIKTRHNEDYDCEEYDCGKGWRTTLLGAMEEAGHPIKTQTLTRYLQSVAVHKGLDEYKADQIANQVERFFGKLEVPADLNPSREQSPAHYKRGKEKMKNYQAVKESDCNNMPLTLYHYDSKSGKYYAQPVETDRWYGDLVESGVVGKRACAQETYMGGVIEG